jgi:hypothetical protein
METHAEHIIQAFIPTHKYIPSDILVVIFRNLNFPELISLQRVNKQFKRIILL